MDLVCSADAVSPLGFTNSCRKYATHIADAFLQSGEIAERRFEDSAHLAGGPPGVSAYSCPVVLAPDLAEPAA